MTRPWSSCTSNSVRSLFKLSVVRCQFLPKQNGTLYSILPDFTSAWAATCWHLILFRHGSFSKPHHPCDDPQYLSSPPQLRMSVNLRYSLLHSQGLLGHLQLVVQCRRLSTSILGNCYGEGVVLL